MKRFILLMSIVLGMMLIVPATTQAATPDADSSIAITATNAAPDVTFSEIYRDVKEGVKAIAAGLSVGAEHVYEVLVRQAVVRSVVFSVVLIIGGILASLFFSHLNEINKAILTDNGGGRKKDYYGRYEWTDGDITKAFILGIPGFLLSLIGILWIDVIITGFVNPEYAAIKEILSIVK